MGGRGFLRCPGARRNASFWFIQRDVGEPRWRQPKTNGERAAVVFVGETSPSDSGNDVLTLETGSSLAGDVFMHAGDDTFNDASGQFTMVSGGDGSDTVKFTGPERTLTNSGGDSDSLGHFEIFNLNAGGFTLAGTHSGLSRRTSTLERQS